MPNAHVAFEVLNGVTPDQMGEVKIKQGFKHFGTHMIFDIKMDGKFTCKARLVAGGHKTEPLFSITFPSVVTRESVRLEFIIDGLNDLYICACDIGNAHLNAPCGEKL